MQSKIKDFFLIKEFKDEQIIWKNGYTSKVVELPCAIYLEHMKKGKLLESIKQRNKEFFSRLNFKIKLIIRKMNYSADEQFEIYASKKKLEIMKDNDKKTALEFDKFVNWVNGDKLSSLEPVVKIYIEIPMCIGQNGSKKRNKLRIEELDRRCEYVTSSFKDSFVLNRVQNIELFGSYIAPLNFYEQRYTNVVDWLGEYIDRKFGLDTKKLSSKENVKEVVKSEHDLFVKPIIQKLEEKKIIYNFEFDKYFELNINENSKDKIKKILQQNPRVRIHDDFIEYLGQDIKKNSMYKYLADIPKAVFEKDYCKVGERFIRGLSATAYPENVMHNLTSPILKLDFNQTITLIIEPESRLKVVMYLNEQLKEVRKYLNMQYSEGITDEKLKSDEQYLLKKIDDITNKKYSFYNVGLVVLCEDINLEKLNNNTSKLETQSMLNGIRLMPVSKYQNKVVMSAAPNPNRNFNLNNVVTTNLNLATIPIM